jgi:DNA-binding winged helix-turn-helix (wHTH) protein
LPNSGRNPDEVVVSALAFGAFVLDPVRGALLRDGSDVRLRAKSLDVLGYLVRHPGRLIGKQELMDAIWPDAAVTDDSLVQCLVEIRRALGDDQAWVHTARGRGYRFDGAVRPIVGSASAPTVALPAAPAAPAADGATTLRRDRPWALAIAVAVLLVVAGGWAAWRWRASPPPRTAEARLACEEGQRNIERRTREALGLAVASYERAIALDPTFAPGHAGLADTLVVLGVFGGARPADSYPRARAAALRAVELDPMLAEGHVALGHVRVQWDRDWRGAEASYRRALALDPRAPRAHMLYALFLGAMLRVDDSLRESATALALRPESPTVGAIRAFVLSGAGRPEEAIEQGRRAIRLDPNFSLSHFWQALALAEVGRFDEAMTEALASRTGVGNLPVPAVGYIHGRAGRRAEALEVLRALEKARERSIYVPATDLALVAVGMGDHDAALTWLERAYDEHAHWIGSLRVWPPFAPLRGEPRFKALVSKMRFPVP